MAVKMRRETLTQGACLPPVSPLNVRVAHARAGSRNGIASVKYPELHQLPALAIHLRAHRLGRVELAACLQRRQHAPSRREYDCRISLPDHRTGAAADPQAAAEFGRN